MTLAYHLKLLRARGMLADGTAFSFTAGTPSRHDAFLPRHHAQRRQSPFNRIARCPDAGLRRWSGNYRVPAGRGFTIEHDECHRALLSAAILEMFSRAHAGYSGHQRTSPFQEGSRFRPSATAARARNGSRPLEFPGTLLPPVSGLSFVRARHVDAARPSWSRRATLDMRSSIASARRARRSPGECATFGRASTRFSPEAAISSCVSSLSCQA